MKAIVTIVGLALFIVWQVKTAERLNTVAEIIADPQEYAVSIKGD